jgi:hypothetical protein
MARPAPLLSLLVAACALAGCSSKHDPPALACIQSARDVRTALRAAPGHVALSDGTTLADCVGAAREASDLQNVGATFVTAASDLEPMAHRNPRVALRLGFLVGAVERGASRTSGLQDELVNRMRGALDGARLRGAERAAALRGRAAGRERG